MQQPKAVKYQIYLSLFQNQYKSDQVETIAKREASKIEESNENGCPENGDVPLVGADGVDTLKNDLDADDNAISENVASSED